MTVTEAPRDAAVEAAAAPSPSAPPTGLAAVVGSGDPRTIGKLFVGTSLLFLLASGVAGTLVGVEQFDSDRHARSSGPTPPCGSSPCTRPAALFLGVLPLLLGPGHRGRPAAGGGGHRRLPPGQRRRLLDVAGVRRRGARHLRPRRRALRHRRSTRSASTSPALIAVVVALAVATVSVVTTVLTLRAPGMTLRRTPLFSWSMLVGGSVWLLTLPVLGRHAAARLPRPALRPSGSWGAQPASTTASPGCSGSPPLYVVAVPALGIIADVVPVFARRRHQRHAAAMVLLGLAAALGFGAWAQLGVTHRRPATRPPGSTRARGRRRLRSPSCRCSGLLGLWTATLGLGKVQAGHAAGPGPARRACCVFLGDRRRRRHRDRGPRPGRHHLDDRPGAAGADRHGGRRRWPASPSGRPSCTASCCPTG